MLHVFALLALAGCAVTAPTASFESGDAHIEVDRQSGHYELVGLYSGPIIDDLTYRLEVTRDGQSGRSRSAQSGVVQRDTLSTSSVNVSVGDRITAKLSVLDGDRVVAEDLVEEVVEA